MNARKEIEIREQKPLGLSRTFNLTLNGIRYRLFRSSVTLAVVAVAVAFLMHAFAESLIKTQLAKICQTRLREYRLAVLWISKLTSPPSLRTLLRMTATAEDGAPELVEMARFAELDVSDFANMRARAADAEAIASFLDRTDYGRLRVLTGGKAGISGLDYLAKSPGLELFLNQVAVLRTVRLPLKNDRLRESAVSWPALRALLATARENHARAIRKLRERLGHRPLIEVLAQAETKEGQQIRELGFELDHAEAARVAEAARSDMLAARVEAALKNPDVRQRLAANSGLLPPEVTPAHLWQALARKDSAGGLIELIGEDSDGVRELARRWREQKRMQSIEPLGVEFGGEFFGLGQRATWLIALSLVVCSVGIANAMLMSVTERYREIATFKCLGALDDTIMLQFIFEAALIGLSGAVLGAFLGCLLGLFGKTAAYGLFVLTVLPVNALLGSAFFAIVVGVTLAVVASIFPSLKAAKLAPMEAMRID